MQAQNYSFVGFILTPGPMVEATTQELHILALCSGGLCLDDSAHEASKFSVELLSAEGSLTDGAVDDVGLVETVLDLTGLGLLNSLGDVGVTCRPWGSASGPSGPGPYRDGQQRPSCRG